MLHRTISQIGRLLMKIIDISENGEIHKKLIQFAKNCSWQSTGSYLAELVNDYNLEEKETVFAAVENDEVVGFVAFLMECVADVKNSDVDIEKINAWLDFLFVDEAYRGQKISTELIEKIFEYCRLNHFNKLYLLTESHEMMYQKYGFSNIGNIMLHCGVKCTVMEKDIEKR